MYMKLSDVSDEMGIESGQYVITTIFSWMFGQTIITNVYTNMIVDGGKLWQLQLIAGIDPTPLKIGRVALGTGLTPVRSNDETLENETVSKPITGVVEPQFDRVVFKTEINTTELNGTGEIGLFLGNKAKSGIMITRNVHLKPIYLPPTSSVQLAYYLTIRGGRQESDWEPVKDNPNQWEIKEPNLVKGVLDLNKGKGFIKVDTLEELTVKGQYYSDPNTSILRIYPFDKPVENISILY